MVAGDGFEPSISGL